MAKKSDVTDPLEAAKIQAPDAPPVTPPGAEEAPAQASAPTKVEEPVLPPPEPVLPPPEPVARVLAYKVVGKHTVSWGGQFLRLSPGDIISEKLYGPGAIERMRDAGVALEAAE